jgi:hypothetical protein
MGTLFRGIWRRVPLLGNLKVTKGRLSMGALWGNLEWAHLPGTLRYGCKGLWRGSVSLYESSVREPGGRAALLGTLKVM